MTKKITKKDNFIAIAAFLAENGKGDWADVINHEIELLDNKAAKAKAKAAEKKAAPDELAKAVEAVLTDELATIADIASKVDFPDATVAKVSYRLRVLAENGIAEKGEVKADGGEGAKARTLVGYKLISD